MKTNPLARTLFLFACSLALSGTSGLSQAVTNGSFESGADPGLATTLFPGDNTTITGWTVQDGSVDYIDSRWTMADGKRCVDLSGLSGGTLVQTIEGFEVGRSYRLSFRMAGNPEGSPTVKNLRASIASESKVYTFSIQGRSGGNMGWAVRTFDFTATNATLTLAFSGLDASISGAALDAVSIVPTPIPTPAPLVTNGSFELGVNPGSATTLFPGNSTTITGWTVQNGSVDYIENRWVIPDGNRCVDMSGLSGGTLVQTVSGFEVGRYYRLSFWMAGNPEGSPTIKNLRASIGPASRVFTFSIQGRSGANMGWVEHNLDFVATNATLTLAFTGLDSSISGAVLDAVSITDPPLTLAIRSSQVEICWPSLPEQIYQIQYRSPLTTNFWTDLGTTILGTGTQNCVLEDVPAEGPPRFYRVIRVLPAQ